MVLRRLAWLVSLCALATACIQRTPPVKMAYTTAVAVAFVQDAEHGGEVADVPDAVKNAVARELEARNLSVAPVPFEKVQDAYSRVRATPRRFAFLAEASQAPLLLLVETKATFFSQISGRYRWVVLAKLTGNLRDAQGDATTREIEQPVILVFDHQRAPQALAEAAPRIAETAGNLFDDLLATPAGEGTPPPPERPTVTPETPPQTGLRLPGNGAIYFVMVDRFANGDPKNDGEVDPKDPAAFHGGDLQGVIDHLDHLQALGVETVWLSPVFQMRTEKFYGHGAFHGYWVEDPTRVEPRFGDVALLRKLSDELHARGMKLVLDIVLNHVGPETKLAKEKPHWFHNAGPLQDWNDPNELVNKDVHGLPDFAVEKPEVYEYLVRTSLQWIDRVRPDGFRLDAVKHMPASFWARYTAAVRAKAGEDFLLLGEMLDGDARTLARTMREGGFNALFDFPLHFAVNDVLCKDQTAARLGAALSSDRLYEDAMRLVTLADNHDLPRLLSTCGEDLERTKQALLLTLTARGTPSLTWGTEAGLVGEKEPENRADMRFGPHPLKDFISTVLARRRAHESLREGIPLLLEAAADRFVYARVTDDEVALIAVNRSQQGILVDPPQRVEGAVYRELLTERPVKAFTVPAGQTRVFVAKVPGAFSSLRTRALAEWKGTAEPRQVLVAASDVPARPGDTVRVVGSGPELGAWDPRRAPAFEKGKTHLELLLPPGSVHEFKLVVEAADGQTRWEDRQNRVLFVRAGGEPIALDLRWDERDAARAEGTR